MADAFCALNSRALSKKGNLILLLNINSYLLKPNREKQQG